jgi:ABC-type oligopeptide transport system ATPase subunit
MPEQTILSVRDIKVHFRVKAKSKLPWSPSRTLKAVDGVSFDLKAGETLGVVGESGCGKSTLSRAILNLIPATQGSERRHDKAMARRAARYPDDFSGPTRLARSAHDGRADHR